MRFDWDEANIAHIARHDVVPHEAEEVLRNDPLDLEERTIDAESRLTQVGETQRGRILTVVVTQRGNLVRVVSAWDAPKALKLSYLAERKKQWPL